MRRLARGEEIRIQDLKEINMPAIAFVIPIPAGNTEALKGAFEEMRGSREDQCVANRGVMGVTREFVSLQHMPQGDVLAVYIEADDPSKTTERMMASDSEYARWIASVVRPLLGTAAGAPRPDAEIVADWRA
jgi:hypothetical protein